MRISDWSSDVCSSDLDGAKAGCIGPHVGRILHNVRVDHEVGQPRMRRIEERIERRRILTEAVAELCTVELKRPDVVIDLRTRGELRAVELRLHARNAGAAPFQLSELSGLANVVEPILTLLTPHPHGTLRRTDRRS